MTLNDNGNLEKKTIDMICSIIKTYNCEVADKLEFIVASLCDVDVTEMMNDTKHMYNTQARWLYWYARRYMTNESYINMAENKRWERKFTIPCICGAINKISTLISANTIWTKRWAILKRIIKESLDISGFTKELFENDLNVKLVVPKGVKVDVVQE